LTVAAGSVLNLTGTPSIEGPLTNNGGPTPTMALLPGSLCIDAGNNSAGLLWDQRETGYNRVVNKQPDIGAYEYGAQPAMVGTFILFR